MEIWKKRKPKDNLKEILELKITITEMKNSLEGFTYRFKQAKRVSELEYRAVGNFKFEEQEKKGLKKSKQSLKNL